MLQASWPSSSQAPHFVFLLSAGKGGWQGGQGILSALATQWTSFPHSPNSGNTNWCWSAWTILLTSCKAGVTRRPQVALCGDRWSLQWSCPPYSQTNHSEWGCLLIWKKQVSLPERCLALSRMTAGAGRRTCPPSQPFLVLCLDSEWGHSLWKKRQHQSIPKKQPHPKYCGAILCHSNYFWVRGGGRSTCMTRLQTGQLRCCHPPHQFRDWEEGWVWSHSPDNGNSPAMVRCPANVDESNVTRQCDKCE